MKAPVLTFFNNKGGVGKTSLAYHLSWMFAELGLRVLAVDLDPQANLTAAFLPDEEVEQLWDGPFSTPATIFRCVQPLTEVGDLRSPALKHLAPKLALLPGDLNLSSFEENLSAEWPHALGSQNFYRPFRVLSAFWQVMRLGVSQMKADLVVVDIGPNLGAINRSALIATDYVVIPLAPDLYSLQGLRNLGPTLRRWRKEWQDRLERWKAPQFELPHGRMQPAGYVAQQHSVRLDRPVRAYERWLERMPGEYRQSVLAEASAAAPPLRDDVYCLATLKHFHSLMPMAHEARKPIFHLTVADGAIGAHALAVQEARRDYETLARRILDAVGVCPAPPAEEGQPPSGG
jgi:cellulose biosynthesis protein BcsQ